MLGGKGVGLWEVWGRALAAGAGVCEAGLLPHSASE